MKKISESIDLKEIEKKAWQTSFDDGIFEIYFGIIFFGITISLLLGDFSSDYRIIGLLIIGLGVVFFVLGKKLISQPRIGKVKFGRQRVVRKTKTIMVFLINFIILLILWIITAINPEIRIFVPGFLFALLFGLVFIALPLCFIAYFLQFKSLYLIAGLTGISFSLEELFYLANIPKPFNGILAFGLISLIIISLGIVIFIKFLKKYPLPKKVVEKSE